MSVTHKLEVVLQATTDAFERGLKKAHQNLTGFEKALALKAKRLDTFNKKNTRTFENLQTLSKWSAGALLTVGGAITTVTKDAMQFETAMAGVKKVVDFDTPQAFKQMEQDIIKLSQSIPMSANGLAEIMAAAGQSGIAQNELLRFTETAAKMGTAFDITAEQAGQAMAEMRVAFNLSQTEVETLADKINYFGNNSPNSAAQILEVVQRVGALGEVAGVSSDSIAALSASLVGVAPDVAATSLKNFMLQLSKGDSLSNSAKAAFEKMGLDYNAVAKGMQTDSEATIKMVLEAAQKVPEHLRAGVLNDAFGSESITAISQLVTNYDNVAKHLDAVGDSSKYAGSMLKEFESMAGTSEAQMTVFNNNLTAFKIALGTALLPAINNLMQAVTPFLQKLTEWATANPELISGITMIATAGLSLLAVLGSVGFVVPAVAAGFSAVVSALGFVTGGLATLVSGIGGFLGVAKTVAVAVAAFSAPFLAAVAAIAAVTGGLYLLSQNWETVSDVVGGTIAQMIENFNEFKTSSLASFNNFTTGAAAKFNEFKANFQTVFNGLPAPVQTALRVMGNVFRTQFNLIKTVVQTAFNVIQALVRGDMEGVKTAIFNGIQNAWNIVKTGANNIVSAFAELGGKLLQAGRDAVQGFINGFTTKMNEAYNKAREMASKVVSVVKSALDIHSPSRVMRELGAWAGEGFVLGVGDKVKDAEQVANDLANALTSTVQDLHRQNFMLLNHANPLAEWDYKLQFGELAGLTDKQKARVLELAHANHELSVSNANNKAINEKIAEINEKILLVGKSELEILQYQLDHAKEYQGVSNEIKQTYLDRTRALQDEIKSNERLNTLQKARDDFAKQQFISQNPEDKYAGERFDSQKQGFDPQQIDELLGFSAKKDAFSAFQNLQNTLRQAMPKDPMADLEAQYAKNLEIILKARESQLGLNAEFDAAELELSRQFLAAKNELMITQSESLFGSMAQTAKTAFGEQSRAYRAIFAMEKGMAIARSVMAIQTAIAQASANPFPMNLGAMATVASQVANIVGNIKAVAMPVGQAHDGIMSVPKSGTWNLEKGERVLPKHTAQNLDNTLNRLQTNGGGQVINVNVTVNSDGGDVQSSHDLGKNLGNAIKSAVQAELQKERRQGGLLYGR